MKQVGPLYGGIKGAEGGTAEIYTRGTAQRSAYYDNAEGTGSTSTADITLDATGRADVYVNEYVTVLVKNTYGDVVVEFTVMGTSTTTEAINQSFTGQAYAGGATGASKPVNLATILDLWLDSAGATNFNVLAAALSTKLSVAIGSFYGLLFNVQNYGAVGDGVTDDTSAIDSTIAAAAAAGGLVFFPVGTYYLGTGSEIWQDVSFVAVPGATTLTGTGTVVLRPTTAARRVFYGFQVSLACVPSLLSAENNLIISNCLFDGAVLNQLQFGNSASNAARVTVADCQFSADATQYQILCLGTQTHDRAKIVRCRFAITSSITSISGPNLDIEDCEWDLTGLASGSAFCIQHISKTRVIGCRFSGSGGGTVSCISINGFSAGDQLYEDGNIYPGQDDANVIPWLYAATATNIDSWDDITVKLGSRAGRVYYESGTIAGTDTLAEQKQYGLIWYNKTDTGALTIDLDANSPPAGHTTVIVVVNASAGTPTLDISGDDVSNSGGAHAMSAGRKTVYYVHYHGADGVVVDALENIA